MISVKVKSLRQSRVRFRILPDLNICMILNMDLIIVLFHFPGLVSNLPGVNFPVTLSNSPFLEWRM